MRTVHASAVLVGARALLVRGPAGAGKSRLVLQLIQAAEQGLLPFARLVADDRVHLEPAHGRLVARPPAVLAGLLEVRGLGIRRLPYEPAAVLGGVIDLGAESERLPAGNNALIRGVTLSRLTFPSCTEALPVLLAALRTAAAGGRDEAAPIIAVQYYP